MMRVLAALQDASIMRPGNYEEVCHKALSFAYANFIGLS
jgi:hypothetical protein